MSTEPANDLEAKIEGRASMRVRLDLVQQVHSYDDATRIAIISVVPDPRRYDRVEREGGTWYLDRYFHTLFRLEDFATAPLAGLPLLTSKRTIDSAEEYAARRKDAISSELRTGEYEPPEEKPRSHEKLSAKGTEVEMAFLSIDICGSTAYRKRDPEGFDIAFQIFLQELGTIVGQFQGSLLKTTGDGFIAYVDGPGFTVVVDTAIDLGGTMLRVLEEAINPAIEAHGLQPIAIRIGADYGPATVREVRVAATGFSALDINSDALNRAVKVEQSAAPNSFRIGQDLYRLAHVQWLERSHRVDFDGEIVGIEGYEVFEVR